MATSYDSQLYYERYRSHSLVAEDDGPLVDVVDTTDGSGSAQNGSLETGEDDIFMTDKNADCKLLQPHMYGR